VRFRASPRLNAPASACPTTRSGVDQVASTEIRHWAEPTGPGGPASASLIPYTTEAESTRVVYQPGGQTATGPDLQVRGAEDSATAEE
jgi:hypothetical protein